jgi:adenosylcobinamide-GDP ribazoletransferase
VSGLAEAAGFLTVVGGGRRPSRQAVPWFPVVGLLLGAALGALWWGADRLWPPLVAAALVVVADLALTGMLHLDGLADTGDGVLPHLDRARRLQVMAEPDVGAFGVGVVVATLLVRVAALAALAPSILLLGGLWALSRSVLVLVLVTQPYARAAGLAEAFRGSHRIGLVAGVAGAAVSLLALVAWGPLAGAATFAAATVAAVGVVALGRRRLGGFTGDVLGATLLVAETVGLLVASARW